MQNIFNAITYWHWLSFSALLIITDLVVGASFFLLWLGVSAATVAIILALIPGLAWEYQLLIFAIESITCVLFWRFYLKRNPTKSDKPRLNRRSEQYIGRVFTLEEPIINGRGKIKVDDSIWKIEGEDFPKGTRVKVINVNGVILIVKKL